MIYISPEQTGIQATPNTTSIISGASSGQILGTCTPLGNLVRGVSTEPGSLWSPRTMGTFWSRSRWQTRVTSRHIRRGVGVGRPPFNACACPPRQRTPVGLRDIFLMHYYYSTECNVLSPCLSEGQELRNSLKVVTLMPARFGDWLVWSGPSALTVECQWTRC